MKKSATDVCWNRQKQASAQNGPSAHECEMSEKCHVSFQAKLRCDKLILMPKILGHLEVKIESFLSET